MGFKVLGKTEEIFRGFEARAGLEGPFVFDGNRILYYDIREGKYWDPRTDFFVDHDEMSQIQAETSKILFK